MSLFWNWGRRRKGQPVTQQYTHCGLVVSIESYIVLLQSLLSVLLPNWVREKETSEETQFKNTVQKIHFHKHLHPQIMLILSIIYCWCWLRDQGPFSLIPIGQFIFSFVLRWKTLFPRKDLWKAHRSENCQTLTDQLELSETTAKSHSLTLRAWVPPTAPQLILQLNSCTSRLLWFYTLAWPWAWQGLRMGQRPSCN